MSDSSPSAHNPAETKKPNQSPLYLARNAIGSQPHYSLRQSYYDENSCLRYKILFDLGEDPGQYIINIGDNGYYINAELVEAIEPYVEGDADNQLEKLFWPFVDHDIRTKLEPFINRGCSKALSSMSQDEIKAIDHEIHVFDRRRLHYMWYGSIDQTGLYKMPDKLCRKLLGKSRDEKEQYFMEQEQALYADDIKEYLFTIFNIQKYFHESFARIMPQALDQGKMDTFFVDELCLLANDTLFCQGLNQDRTLPSYLARYAILFFDYGFGQQSPLDDYIRQFMNSHRHFTFPKKKIDPDELSKIFGEPAEKINNMSKRDLTKLYRQKAKELHPDIGGEHDEFVRLTEAFEVLLRGK